jgi:hypothetical protein
VNENQSPDGSTRLKALLKETGLKSTRLDACRRLVSFRGHTRDWTFVASLYNSWLHIHTYVCEIPDPPGLRAELLDAALAANQAMSLTKFSKSDGLIPEMEYREEHLDAQVLGNLCSLGACWIWLIFEYLCNSVLRGRRRVSTNSLVPLRKNAQIA